MLALPPRYEPQSCLGAGGSGEVWAVRDRVSGRELALKVLAVGAGEPELDALVREAVALSGLEGLGVPRVIAFGALADGRRYMVRELVAGKSLDEVLKNGDTPWLEALASACDALTVVHRAGLLHGDVKPANIIVGPDGRGTLVDLGLAAPWREGGSDVHGMTPRFAAPELMRGEPLTARAEVYALGATLREGLTRRGPGLPEGVRAELTKVATRATDAFAERRWPSVDEFASALRRAGGLASASLTDEPPWPVMGLDALARDLLAQARALQSTAGLAILGPPGSGRTTLLCRLAWTLGAEGCPVAFVQAADGSLPMREAVDLELASFTPGNRRDPGTSAPIVIVDDAEDLDGVSRSAIERVCRGEARLVAVGSAGTLRELVAGPVTSFEVRELDAMVGGELLRRSMPSLRDDLREVVLRRVSSRPGPLRSAVRSLVGKAIVSGEDVDAALSEARPISRERERGEVIAIAQRHLDRGRFDDASRVLASLGEARDDAERVAIGLGRARLAIGKGDVERALGELSGVEALAAEGLSRRVWQGLRARALVRAGRYAEAAELGSAGDRRRCGRFRGGRCAERSGCRSRVLRGRHGCPCDARRRGARGDGSGRSTHRGRGPRVGRRRAPARRADGRSPASVRGIVGSVREGLRCRDGRGHEAEPRGARTDRGRPRICAGAPRSRGGHGASGGQRRCGDAGAVEPRQP